MLTEVIDGRRAHREAAALPKKTTPACVAPVRDAPVGKLAAGP